jgi:hypothetical protein
MLPLTLNPQHYLYQGKKLFFLTILVGLGFFCSSLPASAAEKVILKYKIFQGSIPVADLSALAQQGEVSPALKAHLETANKKPEDLRRLLNLQVKVNAVILSKILKSSIGDLLLDYMSQVIHTPSENSDREALRGSLVTSAISDNRVKLIEVLENYPTSDVYLEGDRIADVYGGFKKIIENFPCVPLACLTQPTELTHLKLYNSK